MKLETMVYDRLKHILPDDAKHVVVFSCVTDDYYELFFYAAMPGTGYVQCYQLAEEDLLDANQLDRVFSQIAMDIRSASQYQRGQINVFTFVLSESSIHLDVQYANPEKSLYRIKKDWRKQYLSDFHT